MSLSVTIDGLEEFDRSLREAGASIRPLVNGALFNSTREIQRNVRQNASHKTGAMQQHVLTSVDYPEGNVVVDVPYGIFVEEGTRPHTIEPVNKKALFWKGALNPYKSVQHPGTKAKPFFEPGVRESVGYIMNQFARVTEILISKMAD